MQRLEITIRGRVQGVAFRHHTCLRARQLGLTGGVRNRPDGTVRVIAEGPRAALEGLLAWAAHGPDHARVDGLEHFWSEAAGTFAGFHIEG